MSNPYYLYDSYQRYAKAVCEFFSSEEKIESLKKSFEDDIKDVRMRLRGFQNNDSNSAHVVHDEAFFLELVFGHNAAGENQASIMYESERLMLKPYSFPAWVHLIREFCTDQYWVDHMFSESDEKPDDDELRKRAQKELELIREALAMRKAHTEYSLYCDDLLQDIAQAEDDLLGWYKNYDGAYLWLIDDVIRNVDIYARMIPDSRPAVEDEKLPF